MFKIIYLYIWNKLSAEAEKAMALPYRSSQRSYGSERYHTCLHLYKKAILEADKVHRIDT